MNDQNQPEIKVEKSDNPTVARSLENIREIAEKNLAISEETLKKTKYIKGYVVFAQVMSVIKVVLVIVPIVLGILYLPSLLKSITPIFGQVVGVYKELLGMKQESDAVLDKIDPSKIDVNKIDPEIIKKYLK